jgi:glycosyltransferase involved in cell wall biosynthesis
MGGVQIHVREISVRLVRQGFAVEIITTDPTGSLPKVEVIDKIKVRRFRSWAPKAAFYFSWSMAKFLTQHTNSYDVVHAHNYHALPALLAAQTKHRNRFILTPVYHGSGQTLFTSLLQGHYRFFARGMLQRADKIICLSRYEIRLLQARFNIPDEKIALIPNGVARAEYESLRRIRHPSQRRILTVSRLEKYKGLDDIVGALSKLPGQFSLDIVGTGSHEGRLVELISKLGLEDRVRISSNLSRKELLQLYANADVFVLLSRFETFGNAVAEALAAGTRCIVSSDSALGDWVDNENCFGLEHPIDLDQLAELIQRTVALNSKSSARADVWDWNDVTRAVAELYE